MNQVALYSLTLWYGLKSKLTYRLSSVFELLGKFLEIFAQILIWVALLDSGARFDTTLSQMVTYLILTRRGLHALCHAGGQPRSATRSTTAPSPTTLSAR